MVAPIITKKSASGNELRKAFVDVVQRYVVRIMGCDVEKYHVVIRYQAEVADIKNRRIGIRQHVLQRASGGDVWISGRMMHGLLFDSPAKAVEYMNDNCHDEVVSVCSSPWNRSGERGW